MGCSMEEYEKERNELGQTFSNVEREKKNTHTHHIRMQLNATTRRKNNKHDLQAESTVTKPQQQQTE